MVYGRAAIELGEAQKAYDLLSRECELVEHTFRSESTYAGTSMIEEKKRGLGIFLC